MVYLRYRQARHFAGLGKWFKYFLTGSLIGSKMEKKLEPLKDQSQYKQLPKEDTDYLVNGM